jgi:ABC-2 type transport system permease protein
VNAGTLAVIAAGVRHQILVYAAEWKFAVVLGVIQPAVLLCVTLGPITDTRTASRVVLAAMLMAVWNATVWNGASILRLERAEGVLAAGLFSRRSSLLVLVSKSLGSCLLSVASILATVTAALLVLRQPIQVQRVAPAALGLLVVVASGTAMGTLLSCVFLVSRFGSQISGALMYPVFLLGGLLIPITTIPPPLRWLSWGLSLRWAMDFLMSCVGGTLDPRALGVAVLLTAVYAVLSVVALRRVLRSARVAGTLDLE